MVKLKEEAAPWQRVEITVSMLDDNKLAHTIWWAFTPYTMPGPTPPRCKVTFHRMRGAPLGAPRRISYQGGPIAEDEFPPVMGAAPAVVAYEAAPAAASPPGSAETSLSKASALLRRRSSRLDGLTLPPARTPARGART